MTLHGALGRLRVGVGCWCLVDWEIVNILNGVGWVTQAPSWVVGELPQRDLRRRRWLWWCHLAHCPPTYVRML